MGCIRTPCTLTAYRLPLTAYRLPLTAYRVQGQGQGQGTWGAWNHFCTAATASTPLTLLYFGDTQNKNLSLVPRVI